MIHFATAVAIATILGDWCAGSKYAFHEEFQLEKNGEFHSWLHQRPALEGKWELHDRTLTIRGVSGDTMTYHILKASKTRLVVHEKSEKNDEIYVRLGHCVAFESPPKD